MGGILVSTTVEARKPSGGDRTEVCHRTGQTFKPKSVPANAVAGHEGHGDGFPLGVVPGQPGMKFDATCNIVPFRTVYIAGPEGGAEGGAIQAALTAFDRLAGTTSVYIATPVQILIDAAVGSGEAPEWFDPATGDPITVDLLIVPQPGAISALADSGAAVPASAATTATVADGWSTSFTDLGSVDGSLYGVPNKVDLKSLVWYKPSTFVDPGGTPYEIPETFAEFVALTDTMVANGQTPLCVGLESGEATGWNFTDWVEDRLLGSEPVDIYDDWITNDVAFTDARIESVWADVLDLWQTPGVVFEGLGDPAAPGVGIALTSFYDAIGAFVFDACLMHRQASFASAIIVDIADGDPTVLDDLATFPFPGGDVAGGNAALGSGTFAVAFDDDVEVALVHEYFGTADYADTRGGTQARLNGFRPSGFLSAVAGQDTTGFHPLEATFTAQLQSADPFRFDASDVMPPEIGASIAPGGFWGEGTQAVIGAGNAADFGPIVVPGKSLDDATQAIADLFCVVAPGSSCP